MSREELFQHHFTSLGKGIFAVVCQVASIAASHLEQVEAWLRVTSLVVGISVGMVTIWSLTRKR